MHECTDPDLGPPVKEALTVLGDALRLYGPASVLGSFNGGKDAVVIFHLLRAALAAHNAETGARVKPQLIYFHNEREFPAVETFVADAVAAADAHLFTYEMGIVDGLRLHIQAQKEAGMPGIIAFVLGTREGDPNSKGQTSFSPSSSWMPPFMRVNPVLSWNYALVWRFLQEFDLPYSSLYDEGYTSLGTVDDTKPNPALLRPDGTYMPAYLLEDWTLERAGRVTKTKPKASGVAGGAEAAQPTAGSEPAAPAQARASRAPRLGMRRSTSSARTVGLVIIGDEILKGKVADTNAPYAIEQMRKQGLDLRRVAVVADTLDDIVKEVGEQSRQFDVVVTSGGVGPTHDDVTIRAVASALGREMERNEKMVRMIEDASGGKPITEDQAKMAMLPEGVRLRTLPETKWPILQAENVFVLPGVPAFFSSKLDLILANFINNDRQIFTRQIVLTVPEEKIVSSLNQAVSKFPSVSFGSYPVIDDPEFKTIVTLEGDDEDLVEQAREDLAKRMKPETIVRRPSKDLSNMLK